MIICNSVHCQYAANNNLWIYTECIQHTFCSFYLFFGSVVNWYWL